MKISAYHKMRGDHVEFVKGCSQIHRSYKWDRIYVATLFSFYWNVTLKTIQYYATAVEDAADVWVGGVLATLMGDEIHALTGVTVVAGLLDRGGVLDSTSRQIVDHLIPDYSILDEITYKYPAQNAYFGYTTRGCPNRCPFCAVPIIEPCFQHYTPIARQVRGIEDLYGPQRDLLLLDNNVLASHEFKNIIHDILDLGFHRGAKFNNKLRAVDFNQGLDARKLTAEKMKLLARIAIRPLRLALDNSGMNATYTNAVKLACDHGVPEIGTYVLFNFRDTPKSFYDRLRLSVELNAKIGSKITSFPMRYIPLTDKDRRHIGPHWNRRLLRGIQCILLSTHGVVSPRLEFFEAAFGCDSHEFMKIASMPEHYIIQRRSHDNNGAAHWERVFSRLTTGQQRTLYEVLGQGRVTKKTVVQATGKRLKDILRHYVDESDKARQK